MPANLGRWAVVDGPIRAHPQSECHRPCLGLVVSTVRWVRGGRPGARLPHLRLVPCGRPSIRSPAGAPAPVPLGLCLRDPSMACRTRPDPVPDLVPDSDSTVDQLVALGCELNSNHYRIVHLAARYDTEGTWLHHGLPNPALGIARRLNIHTSTAREWIRTGHTLGYLTEIDRAFATGEISYAQARILTRWATPDNEMLLLDLAATCSTNRLTTTIARALATDEDDTARDERHHHARSLTHYTNGDGMVIIRLALPPAIAKPLLTTLDQLVHHIAHTPTEPADPDTPTNDPEPAPGNTPPPDRAPDPTDLGDPTTNSSHDASTGGSCAPDVTDLGDPATDGGHDASTGGSRAPGVTDLGDSATDCGQDPSTGGSRAPGVTDLGDSATDCGQDASTGGSRAPGVTDLGDPATYGGQDASTGGSRAPGVTGGHAPVMGGRPEDGPSGQPGRRPLAEVLRELQQRWQPDPGDDWTFPTRSQQRADALCALFLAQGIDLQTEIVIHIRGNGNTFDDGTPITTNAIARQLPDTFVRFLLHDTHRQPIDATNRRRHPTTRQHRVVMETHDHQCIDCGATDLLELDHNPPYHQTRHTITTELEPRCAPCHRTRHRTTT